MHTQPLLFPTRHEPRLALRQLAVRDRPDYRVTFQAQACHPTELLAAIVGGPNQVELGQELLARFGSLHAVAKAHVAELTTVAGIGAATAVRLKAALELAQRLTRAEDEQSRSISTPDDAAALLAPRMSHLEQEHLFVLLLNTRNHVLGEPIEVYHGSVNSTQLRVGEVFRDAVRLNAAGIVVSHNHPSGDASPSTEDVSVTRMLVDAGRLLDVRVMDHLIIGRPRWVSLKSRGLGFA